jgi:thiamine pyrophosphate-dependent acetolactate synthase large subunit-like protein
MDSIPMVIITGPVPTHAIGLDAFRNATPSALLDRSSNTISGEDARRLT